MARGGWEGEGDMDCSGDGEVSGAKVVMFESLGGSGSGGCVGGERDNEWKGSTVGRGRTEEIGVDVVVGLVEEDEGERR
ncbi:hypothetical protein Dimus_037560, partial [Dionaea muscipula]